MIEIEIQKSSNISLIGPYLFFKNILSIGLSHTDIIIDDSNLDHLYFVLEVKKNGLYCIKEEKSFNLYVNKTLLQGTTQIKPQDCISIDNHHLIVKNFLYTPPSNQENLMRDNLKNIMEDDSLSSVKDVINTFNDSIEKYYDE